MHTPRTGTPAHTCIIVYRILRLIIGPVRAFRLIWRA